MELQVDLKDLNNIAHPIDYAFECQQALHRFTQLDRGQKYERIGGPSRVGDIGPFSTYRASERCLAPQTEINVRMRRILIEWLVDVHLKFRLLPETLYICVNLMDRYCQAQHVPKKEF